MLWYCKFACENVSKAICTLLTNNFRLNSLKLLIRILSYFFLALEEGESDENDESNFDSIILDSTERINLTTNFSNLAFSFYPVQNLS